MIRTRRTFERRRTYAPSAILITALVTACGGGSSGIDAPAEDAPVDLAGLPSTGTPVPGAPSDAPASPDAPPVSPFEPAPEPDDVAPDVGSGDVPPGDVVDAMPGETPTDPTSPGEEPSDGTSPDEATSTNDGTSTDDGMSLDDDASSDDGMSPDDGTSTDDGTSSEDGMSPDDETVSGDGMSPDDDASPDDGMSPDDEMSSDDDGMAPGDPTTPDDGVALDAINVGNYVSLTEFAVQMNIVILTDRISSPVSFLERFPGNEAAAFDPPVDVDGEVVLESEDCPLGGTYEVRGGGQGSIFQTRTSTYVDCRNEAGTLSGTISRDTGVRSINDEYDLVFVDAANGSRRTVVDATYDGSLDSQFAAVDFGVEDYSRDGDQDPFSVSGSGTRRLDFENTVDGVFPGEYDTETTIGIETADGPIEFDVTTEGATLDREGLTAGTISLVATDGSRVDVAPGDSPEVVALTLTDSAGGQFADSVAWSELYRLPEATVSP